MITQSQLVAQLYTIRDYIKNSSEIAKSMRRIKEIGFSAVQVSGMGAIEPKELRQILDAEGLVCVATHESPNDLLNCTQKIADKLAQLSCRYTAYPFPSGVDLNNVDSVKKLCFELNESGRKLSELGITLCYHNHHGEFRKIGQRVVLDIIYSETDPRYVKAELDTYWVQSGGCDPSDWCAKLSNRLPLIHLKDFGIDSSDKQVFREVGRGNLDWKKIISAAKNAGCIWFIIEQDGNWLNNDPFESLKYSFEWLCGLTG